MLTLLALLACGAQAYDPDTRFYTLETPHFLVVHPAGYEHIAVRAATIAEGLLPYYVQHFRYEPAGRTTIVIDDQHDVANGSATVLPAKVITIYVTAPTEISGLEDYDDWLVNVIAHELTHIFHLDMAFGLPWVGRLVFGKYIAMNQYTQEWSTEGFAVYQETMGSGAGRGRSSYVDMVIRMAALEHAFPSVDRGFRSYSNWPFGNVAYFIGGRFQLWLRERYGEQALVDYHRAFASDPIPYFSYLPASIIFGASIEGLWSAFEKEMTEDAELIAREVRTSSIGVTETVRLTRHGGDLAGPRITPDGKDIVFSVSSPVDGARIHRMPLRGGLDEVLFDDTFSKQIAFTPNGGAFYIQQTDEQTRFYEHNSILRYDLATRDVASIQVEEADRSEFVAPSGSLRARDPDISPDGKRLVFVQTPYAANRLVLAWIESDGLTIHPKVIVPAEPDVQLSNPRFSPDGRWIAASRFKGGRRDIVIYDLSGAVVREVTRDRAQDVDPTWSSDGQWLIFSSDRTGIYNLYAYRLASDELFQLTNVISGAFQPCLSPDMKTIVFRGYSSDGFDVYKTAFMPEQALHVSVSRLPSEGLDTRPTRWPPIRTDLPPIPAPAAFKDAPLDEKLPEGWRLRDYTSLDTVLPFHDNWNLLPLIGANEREVFGELSTFGTDALGTQTYLGFLTYGTLSHYIGGGAVYSNDQLFPTFSLGAFTEADDFAYVNAAGTGILDYFRRRNVFSGSISLLLGNVLENSAISFGYTFEDRGGLTSPSEELEMVAPSQGGLPKNGHLASVSLGFTYNRTRFFPWSISAERGAAFSFALQGYSKGLGSDYEEVLANTEGRWYLSLPWRGELLNNHVLASRLALSIAGGPDLAEDFRLGGVGGTSALTTTTQNLFPLRGLITAGLHGPAMINGSIEYRAPLIRVERGLGTLPLVLRVLHLGVFFDFGRIFERVDLETLKKDFFSPFATGAGGELRAQVLTGNIEFQLRFGYAKAITLPDPRLDGSGPYFQLGAVY
jgi:Tol biopolymer transport system component